MSSLEAHIVGFQKLSAIYGDWPTFHDAEVLELHSWRGRMKDGDWDDGNVMPVLTIKIHLCIENPGSRETLATMRFSVVDDFRMDGFNQQNAILGLAISVEDRGVFETGQTLPPFLVVRFQSAHGMDACFRCMGIEVVNAVRCTRRFSEPGLGVTLPIVTLCGPAH